MRQDTYSRWLKLKGDAHEETLREATSCAITLSNLHRYAEAKALLRKMIPVARRVLAESDDLQFRMRMACNRVLCEDPAKTLDDLREAVSMLEEIEPTARRVLGGAHPITAGIERDLQEARDVLRSRETPLRFKVGDRVKCCVDEGRWASGTVIKLWYTEDSFAQGFYAPYQVELDDGNLIFAPDD